MHENLKASAHARAKKVNKQSPKATREKILERKMAAMEQQLYAERRAHAAAMTQANKALEMAQVSVQEAPPAEEDSPKDAITALLQVPEFDSTS